MSIARPKDYERQSAELFQEITTAVVKLYQELSLNPENGNYRFEVIYANGDKLAISFGENGELTGIGQRLNGASEYTAPEGPNAVRHVLHLLTDELLNNSLYVKVGSTETTGALVVDKRPNAVALNGAISNMRSLRVQRNIANRAQRAAAESATPIELSINAEPAHTAPPVGESSVRVDTPTPFSTPIFTGDETITTTVE